MFSLIILVVIINFIYFINNNYSLEYFYYDFEVLYFSYLEEEKIRKEKEEEEIKKSNFIAETIKTKNIIININIKNMIKIEQKLKTYKKIIKNKESSSYEIWKAEGLSIKLREDWKKRFNHNKKLIEEIKTYTY